MSGRNKKGLENEGYGRKDTVNLQLSDVNCKENNETITITSSEKKIINK